MKPTKGSSSPAASAEEEEEEEEEEAAAPAASSTSTRSDEKKRNETKRKIRKIDRKGRKEKGRVGNQTGGSIVVLGELLGGLGHSFLGKILEFGLFVLFFR